MAKKVAKKTAPKKAAAKSAPKAGKRKFIYLFGAKTDGDASMRNLLGGKGANLAEMARIGLPVPPGFTITTEVCDYFYSNGKKYPASLAADVKAGVASVERQMGKTFGDERDPLLFSVRSGARESMPGMMDTILNLGLNDKTVEGLASKTGNPRFAWDCYRRFVQMYGDVVMGVQARNEAESEPFDEVMGVLKAEVGAKMDTDLSVDDLKELVKRYKALIKSRTGKSFPQDVYEQLWGAIGAVFNSWMNDRAIIYRQKYNIPASWGTAVNVQTMVFGNKGDTSATGVAFTRDPANGENVFYGEYLINAQGEDVVAGVRTPHKISMLEEEMPKAYKELLSIRKKLERHFKDMQDFEFTIEENKLFMLQTRNGKRTGLSAVRIAVEMNKEGFMSEKTAVLKIPADSISSLLVPVFDEAAVKKAKVLSKGLPAGPGAASGQVVFAASAAELLNSQGKKVILCREETSPEDLRGMIAAEGILTSRGGVSSHAALVARQMGKVCICAASEISMDYSKRVMSVGNVVVKEGDYISIDGTTGEIFLGEIETAPSEVIRVLSGKMKPAKSYTYRLFDTVMKWADKYRKLGVRTNADTPAQAKMAVELGAEGIGLCRTEHMFFEGDRIDAVREMILARPAAPRIPPARELGAGAAGGKDERLPRNRRREVQGSGRAEPDARPPRLPSRQQLSGDHQNAGARDFRGRRKRHEGQEARQGQGGDYGAARRIRAGAQIPGAEYPRGCGGSDGEQEGQDRLHARHHDRGSARRADRRQNRAGGAVLLVRHKRPHSDRPRNEPRRLRQLPRQVQGARHTPEEPVRVHRRRGRRAARAHRRGEGQERQKGHQARCLRRTRRRPRFDKVLQRNRPQLRQLLSAARSGSEARGGAGRPQIDGIKNAGTFFPPREKPPEGGFFCAPRKCAQTAR